MSINIDKADLEKLVLLLIFVSAIIYFVGTNKGEFDGKYCTVVTIENVENPGDYDLTVEISENRLFRIYFPNGGWLDETHFVPKKVIVESDGHCSFKDDRGRDISFFVEQDEKGACEK